MCARYSGALGASSLALMISVAHVGRTTVVTLLPTRPPAHQPFTDIPSDPANHPVTFLDQLWESARELGARQQAIISLLPPQPNERLVYRCEEAADE